MPATLPWNTNQLVPVEAMVAGKRKVEEEDEEEMQHSNKRQCQWTGLQGQGDHAPAPAQFQQHFNLLQQHPQHLRQLEQNQQQQQQQDVEDCDMMDTADTTDNNSMLPQYKQHPTKMMFQQVQSQHTEPRCPSPWPNQPAAMPIHPPQPMPVIPPQQMPVIPPQPMPVIPPQQMPVIPPQQMPQPQQPQLPQQHQEPASDFIIAANSALRKMSALKDCPERGCGELVMNINEETYSPYNGMENDYVPDPNQYLSSTSSPPSNSSPSSALSVIPSSGPSRSFCRPQWDDYMAPRHYESDYY